MLVFMEPVREAEGEGCWETCDPTKAQAWRVSLKDNHGTRSWAYTSRNRAAIALANLAEGRVQPLNVTHGMAQPSRRTVYLP